MRSLLFVPADGGAKLDKAMASGANAVILDLEDSITPERKAHARAAALEFLKAANTNKERPRLLVRINGLDTGMTDADLDAMLTAREAIAGLPEGAIKILAQSVESAAGLFLAGTFRDASARLIGMTWGPEDLSAELGAEANRDAAGLRRDTQDARRDGFAGRLAIHPAQVAVINEVFTPSPEQIAQAKTVVAAFAARPGAGAVGIDGKMYDRPHLLRAQALLARIG